MRTRQLLAVLLAAVTVLSGLTAGAVVTGSQHANVDDASSAELVDEDGTYHLAGDLTTANHSESTANDSENTSDTQTDAAAYQIDVAAGDVIETLGDDANDFYGAQGRLLQAQTVLANGTVTGSFMVPVGEATKSLDECAVTYTPVSYDGDTGEATLTVSVSDDAGCENVTLTLAGYELPGDDTTFVRANADGQELVASQTVTLDAGDSGTVVIDLTEGSESAEDSETDGETGAPDEGENASDDEDSTDADEGDSEESTDDSSEDSASEDDSTDTDSDSGTDESTDDGAADDSSDDESSDDEPTDTDSESGDEGTSDDDSTDTGSDTETETPTASLDDVSITAVQKNAPGDERENLNGETVTITNSGDAAVDLSGVTLLYGVNDENQQTYQFSGGFTLGAGESVTVHTGSGTNTQTDVYLGSGNPVLDNSNEETLQLLDGNGNVIDELTE